MAGNTHSSRTGATAKRERGTLSHSQRTAFPLPRLHGCPAVWAGPVGRETSPARSTPRSKAPAHQRIPKPKVPVIVSRHLRDDAKTFCNPHIEFFRSSGEGHVPPPQLQLVACRNCIIWPTWLASQKMHHFNCVPHCRFRGEKKRMLATLQFPTMAYPALAKLLMCKDKAISTVL